MWVCEAMPQRLASGGFDLGDKCFAAFGVAHEFRDLADLLDRRVDAAGGVDKDHAVAEARQHFAGRQSREAAREDEIGIKPNDGLSVADVVAEIVCLLREVGELRVGCEGREGQYLLGVGQRHEQLVRAEVDGDDPRRARLRRGSRATLGKITGAQDRDGGGED